ncbi:hypothetical protein CY34DRAFT_278640 [Suillus luteus UH-Slu-Lm8-n1]|uniref:Uncharacterized protein n=1 Tax=Suillus luteus UH-Slu-Lm8-n1 TaxID=930992 RepID=A0A0D0BBT8_9AGAM|nr:hypothetical protein CY34DRAFT_278640 [Suillus luteus UH-Slu-Lm8-n1]
MSLSGVSRVQFAVSLCHKPGSSCRLKRILRCFHAAELQLTKQQRVSQSPMCNITASAYPKRGTPVSPGFYVHPNRSVSWAILSGPSSENRR